MLFPATPKTMIERLKRDDMPRVWETAWEEFFDLYHYPVRIVVRGAFRRCAWHAVTEHDVADVVTDVFEAIFRGQDAFALDPAKGRFRQFLTTLCQRRVVDFIRRHKHRGKHDSLDAHAPDAPFSIEASESPALHEEEQRGFETALLGTLLTALRQQVSPQIYLIFELVKLNGYEAAEVATQLGVKRGVVDNSIFKAMEKLRTLAADPAITAEFQA
jgi:RNA polymerase sigma factor (sigma-70 family)